ncbi:MAG TPA: hypothetical protein VFI90_00755, partial [Rubrobacter sp.]|nr:hypothetical protein [Rubrobacter sp.]
DEGHGEQEDYKYQAHKRCAVLLESDPGVLPEADRRTREPLFALGLDLDQCEVLGAKPRRLVSTCTVYPSREGSN